MTQTLLPLQKVAQKNAWVGRMKSGFTTFFRAGSKFDVDKLHDVFNEPGQPNAWGALVNALKEEGHIDPFAGSGTTGRAAKDLGRKCTMIEREEKYCEIAARRMQQEVLAL